MSETKGNDRYDNEEDSPEETEVKEKEVKDEKEDEESRIVYEAIKQLRKSLKILKSKFLPHEIDMLKYRIRVMLGLTKRKNFDIIEDNFETITENMMDLD